LSEAHLKRLFHKALSNLWARTDVWEGHFMTRWKASGIHLCISVLIGVIAFCLLYFVYYPQPFFKAAGADQLTLILLAVDVVIGPLLTLMVYKHGKWGMRFDLFAIASLQLGALLYGAWIMWTSRPVFIVAAVDRIEMVYAGEIEPKSYQEAELAQFSKPTRWGPRFVVTRPTTAGAERNAMIDQIFAGGDIQFLPKFYVEKSHPAFSEFLQRSLALKDLPQYAQAVIAPYILHNQLGDPLIFPMKGRFDDFTVLMDRKNHDILAVLAVSSWTY
jgi:hypothetical protein